MAYLLKNSLHTSLAKTFYSDIVSQRGTYYYFLGRTISWNANDVPPDVPDTYTNEMDIRNNSIFMKKIRSNDISFLVPRINWEYGKIYDRYDGDVSPSNPAHSGATHIKDALFYVLTEEMNVYKCINNNNNTQSLEKPTGTDYDVLTTSDGYIWKYMYSIPQNLQYNFLSKDHMPVLTALNSRYYGNEEITNVVITNGGSGYEGSPVTKAQVNGDGTGATVVLSISPVDGRIANVIVTNPGSGYTTGNISIIDIKGTGHGIYGNSFAVLIPRFIDGKLSSVTIYDPGADYSTDIQTNIIVTGTGKDAYLVPVVNNGEIIDVIIENPGYGYSDVQITIESVTGSGAALAVNTSIGDIDSIQADVELLAIPGAVHVVDVVNQGYGYGVASCKVDGDGTGLVVTPVIYNGSIVKYVVENHGQGYTWCKITVEGGGAGAECRPILSPIHGHGFNAIDELFASSIGIYTAIKFEQNQGIFVNNDYRQFGIVKNPLSDDTGVLFRDTTGSTCYLIDTPSSLLNVNVDDELSLQNDLNKKFIVVSVSDNKILLQNMGNGNLVTNGILIAPNGDFIQIGAVTTPKINKHSGELLFVDNRIAIFQTNEQYISLRTTLKF